VDQGQRSWVGDDDLVSQVLQEATAPRRVRANLERAAA